MSDAPSRRPTMALIREARLAEALTAAWMAVELVVALWAGIAARSVALTAFGIDSGIELVTAIVVLRQLMLHTTRASEEELDRRERQSSRIVGWGLYGLIGYIVVTSAIGLIWGIRPAESPVGVALAVVALLVMLVLWRWRRSLAARVPEPGTARGRVLLARVRLHVRDPARRARAQRAVRLVVGRFGGGAGDRSGGSAARPRRRSRRLAPARTASAERDAEALRGLGAVGPRPTSRTDLA